MALDVMVVDDSTMTRKMIIRALRIAGFAIGEIIEAEDGIDGLEKLAGRDIGLAILDLNMPRMSGMELLDHFRASERFKHLPVIVVSTEGSDTRLDLVRQKHAGFVRKPFLPEALVDAVVTAIGGAA